MTVQSYRKKPVVIQAVRWYGTGQSLAEVRQFLGVDFGGLTESGFTLRVNTLEGVMTARYGDFIIRGVNGEHYACKPDVFAKTYELVA